MNDDKTTETRGREQKVIDFDHKNHVVSKEWLTRTLIQNGFLTSGEVIGVEQKKSRLGGPLTSKFLDVKVKYSTGSRGAARRVWPRA